jgi:hypothetical protein
MIRISVLAGLLLAVGCAPMPAPPAPGAPATEAHACHVERYQRLVGQVLSSADETALPAKHRVICLGCMASMIFVPDRLTIQLGPGKTVASVRCG